MAVLPLAEWTAKIKFRLVGRQIRKPVAKTKKRFNSIFDILKGVLGAKVSTCSCPLGKTWAQTLFLLDNRRATGVSLVRGRLDVCSINHR